MATIRYAYNKVLWILSLVAGKWMQILGVFSSKSNVKANVLAKIVLEATLLCEQAGLFVDGVTCDAASWNRSMWRIFGIRGKLGCAFFFI